jgi:hypothetical protein
MLLTHNVIMAEVHPFTFKIETDPLREMRYRWTVRGRDRSREDPLAPCSPLAIEIENDTALLSARAAGGRYGKGPG